jgi:hypothetical protein
MMPPPASIRASLRVGALAVALAMFLVGPAATRGGGMAGAVKRQTEGETPWQGLTLVHC